MLIETGNRHLEEWDRARVVLSGNLDPELGLVVWRIEDVPDVERVGVVDRNAHLVLIGDGSAIRKHVRSPPVWAALGRPLGLEAIHAGAEAMARELWPAHFLENVLRKSAMSINDVGGVARVLQTLKPVAG